MRGRRERQTEEDYKEEGKEKERKSVFPMLIRTGEEGTGLLGKSKCFVAKMNGSLEEHMGGTRMIVLAVCLGVESTNFWFLSCYKSQSSLAEKLPGGNP